MLRVAAPRGRTAAFCPWGRERFLPFETSLRFCKAEIGFGVIAFDLAVDMCAAPHLLRAQQKVAD